MLLQIPAVVRFLSVEPMLSEIDLTDVFGLYEYDENKFSLKVGSRWADSPDWVICGGESGKNARPMHPDWVRSLRDQCKEANVPFFFKQWGEYAPTGNTQYGSAWAERVGAKKAGHLLDGVEYRQFPEAK